MDRYLNIINQTLLLKYELLVIVKIKVSDVSRVCQVKISCLDFFK